jgi:allophanate hydrolase
MELVSPDPRLTGLWRRSLLVTAGGATDTTTDVTWLQAGELYVDLRLPASTFTPYIRCLRDLDRPAACALAQVEGFAGRLLADGPWARWERLVDLQPSSATADEGRLVAQNGVAENGHVIETGRHVDYVEHWHRTPGHSVPVAGLLLRETVTRAIGVLVRVGRHFAWARGRAFPLPPGGRLVDHVAAARTIRDVQDLLDAEVAVGRIGRTGAVRTGSNLPWRVGAPFHFGTAGAQLVTDDVGPDGGPVRRAWEVLAREGALTDPYERRT